MNPYDSCIACTTQSCEEPSLETTANNKGTHYDIIEGKFSYALYADESVYYDWENWVSMNSNLATDAAKDAILKFSDYAIEVMCMLGQSPSDDIGCCLKDQSDGAFGGWCLLLSGSGTAMDTYRLSE